NWAKAGDLFVLADRLAIDVFRQARVTAYTKVQDVPPNVLAEMVCDHPLKQFNRSYDFPVPLLEGDHVSDDAGTGFVHTAPGHGREDFEVWTDAKNWLIEKDISFVIPYTVDSDGRFTFQAFGFEGRR